MNELYTNVSAEYVSLGGGLRGYFARPVHGGVQPGIVLFQEAFGLNPYVESEVRRLAASGYAAIAPDIFRGKQFSYADMAPVMANMQTLTDEGLLADAKACLDFFDGRDDIKHEGYGAIGFCMGGRLAFLAAAEFGSRIAAAVAFYGGGIAPAPESPRTPQLHRIPGISASLLMIYGADDHAIDATEHGRLAAALSAAKKEYAISVYPDAGHGFASRDRDSYRPDVADVAWRSALRFFFDKLDHERSAPRAAEKIA